MRTNVLDVVPLDTHSTSFCYAPPDMGVSGSQLVAVERLLSIEGALEIKKEIEKVALLKFTGIINNANLGNETTVEYILKGYKFCTELSKVTGLPVKFTSVRYDLINNNLDSLGKILPVKPIKYGDWL